MAIPTTLAGGPHGDFSYHPRTRAPGLPAAPAPKAAAPGPATGLQTAAGAGEALLTGERDGAGQAFLVGLRRAASPQDGARVARQYLRQLEALPSRLRTPQSEQLAALAASVIAQAGEASHSSLA